MLFFPRSEGGEQAHLALQEQGCHFRVQAHATLKACVLELSVEGHHPAKVWCVVAVGAVRSGGWQWGGSSCWGLHHLHSPAPPPRPRMLQNVGVPVAVFEWSLPVGSTDPAQPEDPFGAPLSGINPSAFGLEKR